MTDIRDTPEYDEIVKTTEYAVGYNDGYREGLEENKEEITEIRKTLVKLIEPIAKMWKDGPQKEKVGYNMFFAIENTVEFCKWATTWLALHPEEEKMTKSVDPFEKSAFTYSFFYGGCEDFFKLESEYNVPNYAESAYRYSLTNDDGDHKAYFGIYDRSEMDDEKWDLYADIWDKSHTDLVGCATIKDWEWLEVSGNETFDKGVILDCLNSELKEITEWIYDQGIRKE